MLDALHPCDRPKMRRLGEALCEWSAGKITRAEAWKDVGHLVSNLMVCTRADCSADGWETVTERLLGLADLARRARGHDGSRAGRNPAWRSRMTAHSIIAALDDPALFEPWFRGESWNGWRAVLKAMHRLPMSDDEIAFFNSVAERDPPKKPVREAWASVGRGGGKDSIASVIVGHTAATFEPYAGLRPGERPLCLLLACDREQAKICLSYVRSYFTDIPLLSELVTRETRDGFELSNGVDIAIATNSFRAVRGRSILCCVLDECAFYRSDESANPDEELYRALRPALARVPGSMLIGISSPYKKSGLLWRKFQDHFAKDESDTLVVRAPTRLLNPTFPQDEVDAAMADDPASAAAEYMAEFRGDISNFIDRDSVHACVTPGLREIAPEVGVTYVAFVDAATGSGTDDFALAIGHMRDGEMIIVDAIRSISPKFSPANVVAELSELMRAYGVTTVYGDNFAGGFVRELFEQNNVTYEAVKENKSQLYLNLLSVINARKIELLDHVKSISQLCNLERRVGFAGKDRIDHPDRAHDDAANVVAGLTSVASFDSDAAFLDRLLRAYGDKPSYYEERAMALARQQKSARN